MARRQYIVADTFADLRTDGAMDGSVCKVQGKASAVDGMGGYYQYDSTSSAVASDRVVRPAGFTVGAWIRQDMAVSATTFYNASGPIEMPLKKWVATITPSSTSGYSIDISSAGFTSIIGAQVIAIKNAGTATLVPNVAIKTISTTTLVVNVIEGSSFADISGLSLYVEVSGY